MTQTTSALDVISPSEALRIVSSFFENEWPATAVSHVQMEKMRNGWRDVYLVRHSTPAVNEPSAVILRRGFCDDNDLLTPHAEETVLALELSRRGWGAHVYGLSGRFRVEEYIESRALTPDDCKEPLIWREVARSYACFHSLDMPFTRSKFDLCMKMLVTGFSSLRIRECEITAQILESGYTSAPDFARRLFAMDYELELTWIKSVVTCFHCKKTLMHFDANFQNLLVHTKRDMECRVTIIDYDVVMYGYRGLDIGAHFVNRMLRFDGIDNMLSGHPFPGEEEQIAFLQFYLQSMEELGQEVTTSDSVAHLKFEAEVGAMMYAFSMLLIMSRRMERCMKEPAFLSGMDFLIVLYPKLKQAFIEKYPHSITGISCTRTPDSSKAD